MRGGILDAIANKNCFGGFLSVSYIAFIHAIYRFITEFFSCMMFLLKLMN